MKKIPLKLQPVEMAHRALEGSLEVFQYVKYFALIELKYINKDEKATKQKIETLIKEAKEQLEVYEKDELVTKHLHQATLKKIVMVFHGWRLVEMREVFSV